MTSSSAASEPFIDKRERQDQASKILSFNYTIQFCAFSPIGCLVCSGITEAPSYTIPSQLLSVVSFFSAPPLPDRQTVYMLPRMESSLLDKAVPSVSLWLKALKSFY